MCRLYALQATHSTPAECGLLDAQNALIDQSRRDARGLSNPHEWGMASLDRDRARCFRQVDPASGSETYRAAALGLEGDTLLAHVRRATVGDPVHENTHLFRHEDTFLIHNGHVPAFDAVWPRLLDRLPPERRGTTDSEHVFAPLLKLRAEQPGTPLQDVTRQAVQRLQTWCETVPAEVHTDAYDLPFDDPDTVDDEILHRTLALNLLWTDGSWIGGARLNRSLWALRRTAAYSGPVCGDDHTDAPEDERYQATVVASERITDEDWQPVLNGPIFHVGDDGILNSYPIDAD